MCAFCFKHNLPTLLTILLAWMKFRGSWTTKLLLTDQLSEDGMRQHNRSFLNHQFCLKLNRHLKFELHFLSHQCQRFLASPNPLKGSLFCPHWGGICYPPVELATPPLLWCYQAVTQVSWRCFHIDVLLWTLSQSFWFLRSKSSKCKYHGCLQCPEYLYMLNRRLVAKSFPVSPLLKFAL